MGQAPHKLLDRIDRICVVANDIGEFDVGEWPEGWRAVLGILIPGPPPFLSIYWPCFIGPGIHPPDYILVTCPDLDITLPGLPPSVVPIQPKIFTYRSGKRKATFYQFPVTLAYAITDYKCQSLTFEQVVVDLKRPSPGFAPAASAYVQLSRCRALDQLSIIRHFDPSELTAKLSGELSDELKWEEEMDLSTREKYDSLINARLQPLSD